jgi:hypothetical protein
LEWKREDVVSGGKMVEGLGRENYMKAWRGAGCLCINKTKVVDQPLLARVMEGRDGKWPLRLLGTDEDAYQKKASAGDAATSKLQSTLIGPIRAGITCWKATLFTAVCFCANCCALALFRRCAPAVTCRCLFPPITACLSSTRLNLLPWSL